MVRQESTARQAQSNEITFYVFDNLSFWKSREGGDVLRFGTNLDSALEAYERIREDHPEWSPALGCNIGGHREVDLFQCRGDETCLITDYRRMDGFKDNLEVKKAVETAAMALRVDWQVDHDLIGCSILVPLELGENELDRYTATLKLRPANREDVLTSVQDAFVKEFGWMDPAELRAMAKERAVEEPPLKVTAFTIAYESTGLHGGRSGYISVSPADFRVMKQGYERDAHAQESARETSIPEAGKSNQDSKSWRELIEEARQASKAMSEHDGSEHVRPSELER